MCEKASAIMCDVLECQIVRIIIMLVAHRQIGHLMNEQGLVSNYTVAQF